LKPCAIAEGRTARAVVGAEHEVVDEQLGSATEQISERCAPNRGKRGFLGESDVEDVVQEVLLSVHAVRATYDPARPLMPWLSPIVRHRLADAARRHVRQGAHEIGVDDLDVTFQAPAANDHEDAFGDPDALAQAIHALPPGRARRSSCSNCANSR
jgi:DNA-directed RNA polymerase specialized sigma24 family protein